MSRTLRIATPTRSLAAPAALLAVLVAVAPGAAAQHPLSDSRYAGAAFAWSEPNPALGGVPLAAYVARHQLRALGEPGV